MTEGTNTKIDWSVFNWPKILFTEVRIPANGAATTPSDQLKCGRDMLIDWIGVSEETFSVGVGAANDTYLNDLSFNWWIHDRAQWAPQVVPAAMGDTYYDGLRDANLAVLPTVGMGSFQLHHPVKWLYPAFQNVAIEWVNPVSNAPTGNLQLAVSIHGVGTTSGHRRIFGLPFIFATNAAGQTQNIASVTATMGNPGDQSYLMTDFHLVPRDVQWQALGDNRVGNHLRIRVRPTNGDAWSDVPVPITFYGIQRGQPQRIAWFQPPGGPILLRRNQQPVFQFTNGNGAIALNVQTALVGRVAPSYKDIE